MKNSWTLLHGLDEQYRRIIEFDLNEIDNPDPYNYIRLHYLARIHQVISLVERYTSIPRETNVGDFGCAQGNTSLLLAERGYDVFAIDQNRDFVEYAKRKYERGGITWLVSRFEQANLPTDFLDVAIMGEVVDQCASPQAEVAKILRFIRPTGVLIITALNGSRIHINLPTLAQVRDRGIQGELEARQFGDRQLFKIPRSQINLIVPPGARVIESGYCGGTVVMNRYTEPFLRAFPLAWVEGTARAWGKIPLLNWKTSRALYIVLRK